MDKDIRILIEGIKKYKMHALSRAISWVENGVNGSGTLLKLINIQNTPVIGITGPPGSGKSTLLSVMTKELRGRGKKIGILAVDPTSVFHKGSLLGDRLRMESHFNDGGVFIRSVASRGYLGGLSAKVGEMLDVMKAFDFDIIFLETVGVGQSEIEVAGYADCVLVVLNPESGDDIQALKSGILEIGDIFVVNKSDRSGADRFLRNLKSSVHLASSHSAVEFVKTVATVSEGIVELIALFEKKVTSLTEERKLQILLAKAYQQIREIKMREINETQLLASLSENYLKETFNMYTFIAHYVDA